MAKEYEIEVVGQPYFGNRSERTYTIWFDEPENGINSETGLCLLIAGFGGSATNKVYKKMRSTFADEENLVTIQCNYLGYEFMTKELNNDIFQIEKWFPGEDIQDLLEKAPLKAEKSFCLNESSEKFCEMGLFQAMDNLRAMKIVQDILRDNKLEYNKNRVIAYGESQGAYLCYFCNALNPNLFSGIIDNSAWLCPCYFYKERPLKATIRDEKGKIEMFAKIHYMAKEWISDLEIYDLNCLYQQFTNKAKIISFHGTKDTLSPLREKEKFLEHVANASLIPISPADLDGEMLKNAEHGLGADFLKLFFFVVQSTKFISKSIADDMWSTQELKSDLYTYKIMLENNVPTVFRIEN